MLKWTKPQNRVQTSSQQQQLKHRNRKYRRKTIHYSLPSLDLPSKELPKNCRNNCRADRKSLQPTSRTIQEMPTMTHTLERRLLRRSLDNQLDDAGRHSLTSQANKENFGVHFMRRSCGNTSLTALHDISNGKSPQRQLDSRAATPLTIKQLNNNRTSSSRRRAASRISAADDAPLLSRVRFSHRLNDEGSPASSSSRMGDTTLDRMLDAIIESARKDVKIDAKPVKQPPELLASPRAASLHGDSDFEASIHEMEVRTPTHLKRQRVVRRKKNAAATVKKQQPLLTADAPPTPPTKYVDAMDTPQHAPCVVSDDPPNFGKELQRCSTPTQRETLSIKRCLNFSPPSDEEIVDDADYSSAKRSSVASSNASSTCDPQLSASSVGRSNSQRSVLRMVGGVSGSLELAVYVEREQLYVHVIRCRDLQRSNGSTTLNAYVKVALIRSKAGAEGKAVDHGFQRTAVHRHSNRPFFDHRFRFDLSQREAADGERLQLAVWHRDRQLKRSEFLGCISLPLQSLLRQPVSGSFRLQSQACLSNPQPAVLVTTSTTTATTTSAAVANISVHQATHPLLPGPVLSKPLNMATLTRQKASTTINNNIDDEAVSIDSMALPPPPDSRHQPISLSKKAIHQRDADENLFLRFLELDPPTEVAAAPASSGGMLSSIAAAVTNTARRHSGGKQMGRTPFTMTKKLTRTAERGFGFSIVWTHPPRVEKIEPGLSADRSGILPGDYVIFVDKHNVVTMPEADVLNLIRSQGATLTLEIFRRSGSGGGPAAPSLTATARSTTRSIAATGSTLLMNGNPSRVASVASNCTNADEGSHVAATASSAMRTPGLGSVGSAVMRPSTACSGTSSIEAAKRRLNLPQVTFSKESIAPITDNRRRFLLQLISREQNFISALHFGMQRFVQPLQERKDLISPNDHRTLFQNIDELLRISEDILEQLCNDDQEPQMNFASRVYLSKTTTICAAYKKYCNGIKRADCVLVNKSRQAGSDFIAFITEPQVPRKRPDLCMLIHRPLQHFREILKLMQLLSSNCHVDSEEHKNFGSVINELQAAYREITVSSGLMEPLGEGRPLLTLQDLESRMVFTKCKPFTLAVQGRQWIFGGDLSRVEGRSVKPYWTLLFSDIIVFAKVSRDRVLFITEEPIPIANVVDSCFHMRKKTTEFRLTIDPNGRLAESPTGYCAPDLSRTPKKNARRKSLVLRAPSLELKAVWQNLLQRQIFLVNAALGSTPLSSPLDSPDVLNTLVPLSDVGVASASIVSIKLSSMDSISQKNQQQSKQRHSLSNPADQIELLIDEKCRILNKTGTPKSSALHLANWMKGQLDKQQEQARLAAERSREHISCEDEHLLYNYSDQDERITYWTRQQLEKRTKELNLIKENGKLRAKPDFGGKRLSGVEELSMSDAYSENVSQLSQSRSTTSDSQITVRSSPNVLDKLAVCHHCHKHCQQSISPTPQPHTSFTSPPHLLCNSLKVQHSQSSSHRCCRLNGGVSSKFGSSTSISSSTVTGEQHSEHSSSKLAANAAGNLETGECDGDTESSVALVLTDEISLISQSDATNSNNALDSGKALNTTSAKVEDISKASNDSGVGQRKRSLCNNFNKIRDLDPAQPNSHHDPSAPTVLQTAPLAGMNGHISSGTSSLSGSVERTKPDPPPRRLKTTAQTSTTTELQHTTIEQRIKDTVFTTETVQKDHSKTVESNRAITMKFPKSPNHPQSKAAKISPTKYTACSCDCTPADFEHTTLSPDELEQQTCKLLDSPKKSPKMLPHKLQSVEDPHKYCKCVCGKMELSGASNFDVRRSPRQRQDNGNQTKSSTIKSNSNATLDEDCDLPLVLLGLAGITPATQLLQINHLGTPGKQTSPTFSPEAFPTLRAPASTPAEASSTLDGDFVPTIAVVPPTPDSVLTKTTTNIWDNSGHQPIQQLINSVPRNPVVEHIQDDSGEEESPGDEEPPYRPMNKSLRRYGTMSSLEKLPSDDRMDDGEVEELEDDGNFVDNMSGENLSAKKTHDEAVDIELAAEDDNDEFHGDDLENELRDELEAEFEEKSENQVTLLTRETYKQRSDNGDGGSGSAWASRAGTFVAGKMSFFEESRAFIDKYLGRWNQEQASNAAALGSEAEDQLDECTSGATSGEEVWGTPTSGGDNDEMQVNSENTHSSPTKSSTSLNDDDDTELMMDELLMAPPMTASTIRGLLPRRRLEPLFEEETESDEEEKTQQESDELKKGETTTNGRDPADSAGSSSEEDEDDNLDTGTYQDEDDETTSTEERLQLNLPTTPLGPRPLRSPGAGIPLPTTILRGSSCEYLLEQRSVLLTASSCSNSSPEATASSVICSTSLEAIQPQAQKKTLLIARGMSGQSPMIQTNSTVRMTQTLLVTSHMPSLISTTTSNAQITISNSGEFGKSAGITRFKLPPTSTSLTTARPARFIPPPPPPRRLLLTQTNLKTGGNEPIAAHQKSSGDSADAGSSAAVVAGDATPKIDSSVQRREMSLSRAPAQPMPTTTIRSAYNTRSSVCGTAPDQKRPSSTIIETSLLAQVNQEPASTSSTTVSTTTTNEIASKASSSHEHSTADATEHLAGSGLSPRLEMRLALNHDILGDEDLICYDPGPDLTTILGHDLSTFHRLTGRDLLHRSATNRVQPREAVISFSQQRNSKMDTPTVNRRPRPCPSPSISSSSSRAASGGRTNTSNVGSGGCVAPLQSLLRPNRNTWSSSASAERNADESASGAVSCKSSYSSDEAKLSDLEILARREKIFCMSQSRSGSPATRTLSVARVMSAMRGSSSCEPMQQKQPHPMTRYTISKGLETEQESVGGGGSLRMRKVGCDAASLNETGKANRLINFIKRRNSEAPLSPNCSQSSLYESNANSTPERRQVQMSPRKDNDKPSLNRRLWKQITKRRRANSVSEIAAN